MLGLRMSDCRVNGINSYAEAVAFYNTCPTSGGMRDGVHRAIKGKSGSRATGVRMSEGSVMFRYHSTDVVTWRPDGSYVVDLTYTSRSTCEFANRFIPDGHYAEKEAYHLRVEDFIYPAACNLVVRPDGTVTGMIHKFYRWAVDKRRARKFLESVNYPEFQKWHAAMFPLVRDTLGRGNPEFHMWNAINMLEDPDLWHSLMIVIGGNLAALRHELYERAGVYDEISADRLPSTTAMNKWRLG